MRLQSIPIGAKRGNNEERELGMVHYSKKDWWLVTAACSTVVIPLTLGSLLRLSAGATSNTGNLLIIVGALIGVVLLWLTYPLHYRITSSELIVRCGILMNKHIPLASILGVERDRNLIGAPAWSLDRLRVDYRKNGEPDFIMISPDDKAAFLLELAIADANLIIQHDRLIRESRVT